MSVSSASPRPTKYNIVGDSRYSAVLSKMVQGIEAPSYAKEWGYQKSGDITQHGDIAGISSASLVQLSHYKGDELHLLLPPSK